MGEEVGEHMGYLEAKVEQVRARRLTPADAAGATAMLKERCRSKPAPASFAAALSTGDTVTLVAGE